MNRSTANSWRCGAFFFFPVTAAFFHLFKKVDACVSAHILSSDKLVTCFCAASYFCSSRSSPGTAHRARGHLPTSKSHHLLGQTWHPSRASTATHWGADARHIRLSLVLFSMPLNISKCLARAEFLRPDAAPPFAHVQPH